jgi:pentatricopeptide repeat protein
MTELPPEPSQPEPCHMHTLNAVHGGGCGERQWERLEAVVAAMQAAGMAPDEPTYNKLIDVYGRRKQWDRLKAAKQLLRTATGGAPHSMETYAALVRAYGRGRKFELIDEAIAEMQATGLKPTLAVYNALIVAYGRAQKADLAVRYLPTTSMAGDRGPIDKRIVVFGSGESS